MRFKPQVVIVVFLILWIIFIGWGVVKTTIQLSKQEALLKETPLPEAEIPQTTQHGEPLLKKTPPPERLTREGKTEGKTLEEKEVEAPLVLVRTFKVKTTDFSDLLPVMGTVKGETEIELKFEINGVIKSIHFREGKKANKGDLLVSLNPKDAQLKVEYAKNKLASAQASYQSSLKKLEVHQHLYQAGAIIKSRLEEVESESEKAKFESETIKSEEELARNELEKTNLYAPFNGVMGPREAEEGEFVTPQDKVASFLEIENIMVEAGIVERDINKIKLGQKAKVYVDAHPNVTFEGEIDNIFPIVEGKSRTLTTKIKVNNPNGLLLPGMFCRAEISIIELNDALIIPSTSLISAGAGATLAPVISAQSLKTDKDEMQTGIVKLRAVKVGYMTSDYAQIVAGLNEGDMVVIEAQGELKDNAKVRISATEEVSF